MKTYDDQRAMRFLGRYWILSQIQGSPLWEEHTVPAALLTFQQLYATTFRFSYLEKAHNETLVWYCRTVDYSRRERLNMDMPK